MLYRLYIDESGNHQLGPDLPEDQPNLRFFGLSGVILSKDTAMNLFIEFEKLKRKYFKDYDFDLKQLVFHRKEICDGKGPFRILKNDKQIKNEFDNEILKIINETPFTLITIVIDKYIHYKNYSGRAFPPYEYCLEVLLERYCFYLKSVDGKGDVLSEGRGGKEDQDLKTGYKHIYHNGKHLNKTGDLSSKKLKDYLSSTEIKIKKKAENIAGLQLCDLIVHDSMYEILEEEGYHVGNKSNSFRKDLIEILQTKYYKSSTGKIKGLGKKLLEKE